MSWYLKQGNTPGKLFSIKMTKWFNFATKQKVKRNLLSKDFKSDSD